MTENYKKFLEVLSEDSGVEEQIKALKNNEDKEYVLSKVIEIASNKGIELQESDFKADELSEDELKSIAGGTNCACYIGGGGTETNNGAPACACVLYGQGNDSDGGMRCVCPLAGGGAEY